MLTVGSLVRECELELAAGADAADREIRWVHISELEDPTPWLSGGELLLTTGIQLTSATRQRTFVELLASKEAAGIGVGTGFSFKRVPKALAEAAEQQGLPLFEIPYEMPFIAITEYAFGTLVNDQYDVLQRAGEVHERLERLVLEGRGLGQVLDSIATAVGGSALVLDSSGHELDRHPPRGGPDVGAVEAVGAEMASRDGAGRVGAFEPAAADLDDRALVVPVSGRRDTSPIAWLLVVSREDRLGDFERLIARQAFCTSRQNTPACRP